MSLKVSRILHAGYVFECEGRQIAFDPIFENPFSRNCYAFPNVQFDQEEIRKLKFAAVFISHYHDDHCSLESLNFLDRETPIYVYCLFDELLEMIRQLGFKKVHSLQLNHSIQIGPIEITARRALDADVDSIFHISAQGLNVLNVVDSWIDPETLDQYLRGVSWDLILWPFQTMRELEVLCPLRAEPAPHDLPVEWIEQLRILKPKHLVPSSCQFLQESWSWYNHAFFPISYRQFEDQIRSALPGTQVARMNPSVSVELNSQSLEFSSPLDWIQPLGEQNVDYHYDPNLKAPSTAEIARHFEPLAAEEIQTVLEYCQTGLIKKYNSMDPPEDPYFSKPRLWRLSLYGHAGEVTHFYYRLQRGSLKLAEENQELISWTTEVPIAKLFAALGSGESLTSMYVRINDIIFPREIEMEIQAADVIEDPLIRCLFTGAFGSYQRAQLQSLGCLKAAPIRPKK